MLVQKFGGGTLSNRTDFERAAAIIRQSNADVIVVSAVKGVTDQLIALLHLAKTQKEFSGQLAQLKKMHAGLADEKIGEINTVFIELERFLQGVSYTSEYSEKLYAYVLSRGEYLSARILQSYLPDYTFWPAENGIIGQEGYMNAKCDFASSKKPPQKSIVTGFYSVNSNKEVCLFGRGGSDYSAAALARITNADKLEFWKDVDGFMTADPKITAGARLTRELSFEEAGELCRFGAKILHPSTLEPLLRTNTIVEIKNVLKPLEKGTTITKNSGKNEIAAITGRKSLAVVSVSGEMAEAFGVASSIFSRVANAGIPIDVIATTQANLSFSVEEKNAHAAMRSLSDLEQFEKKSKTKLALVGIVGNGIKGNPEFIANVFSALSRQGIQIEMISQGASEIELSIILNEKDYETAIRSIHEEFFNGGKK